LSTFFEVFLCYIDIWFLRWVRGGKVTRDIQLGTDHASEGCKLGREVMFHGFHFCVYGGMHVFIDGGNIGTEFLHFFLGFCENRGQGIEAGFQVLATSVGHVEGGKWKGMSGTTLKKGIMTIRVTRGIQWGKAQIRGSKRVRVHEKNFC
jgi:hypothetical protein